MGSIFVPSMQRRLPTAGTYLWRAVLVALVLFGFGLAATGSARAQDSKGADFWLTFPGNLGPGVNLSLFITGDTATSGTVSIPGLVFSAPFTVTPGAVTTVALPFAAELNSSDTVENKGIHVTAAAEVTVYGLTQRTFTTDAYLGLPTDALGTDYINLGYENVNIVNATQFGIVATEDTTAVTITPTVTTDGHAAGVAYVINLNQGQTYLLRNTDAAPADLSGTLIQSDKPIAVFGGHQCANIPAGFVACDTVVEELSPTTAWGKNFVSMPLATRTGGDTFRVLASEDVTDVKLNGVTVATLNRGQLHEQIVSGPAQITSDKPVLVMQYSNSSSFDGVTSDPFQMMIPPYEQFLAGYTVSTPASGFTTNFINVVAPTASVGAVILDGVAIPAGSFTAIGGSGFSGAQVPVALGSHTLSGPLPFGVHSYGFASFDSYGYPGGLSLSEIARVDSVVLAPKTATNPVNTQHCVTATVKDQNGDPLPDIRVDFIVTGVNPTTGFAFTNASGEAQFCYTGTNAGDDTIVGTVGTLSDTAAKTWSEEEENVPSTKLTKTPSRTVVGYGRSVTYTYTEENDGEVDLTNPSVVDDTCSPVAGVLGGDGIHNVGDTNLDAILNIGETWTFRCSMRLRADTTNTAVAHGFLPDGTDVTWCADPTSPPKGVFCDQDEYARATVDVVAGCTPGYWKQSQHFGSWTTPYDPTDPFFSNGFENAFPNKNLLFVLGNGGGGLNALGRHTVAALLNAANPTVSGIGFPYTTAQVISMFNAAFPGTTTAYNTLKNQFEAANERGCPLGRDED